MKWVVPRVVHRAKTGARPDQRELIEDVATWTEQLRDTIVAAHGLEQAIVVTSELAPFVIAPAVHRLAAALRYGAVDDALRRFADEVNHPTCDFVVAALITAYRHQARELGALLTHLSECAREESRVQLRVWVSRARTRSAVRIIGWVVVLFAGALVVFDPSYLAPFATSQGVFMLTLDTAIFVSALLLLRRLSNVGQPQRFIGRRVVV
jgi:Flp pilus assembly protein TadB